ncbi:amidase [Paenibacillus tengchongensis]|uniref:amidase n=1 Tax=Paenibacillus tengchongensis TaxID=2608684 RepID=UPI00124BD463|nr:amidase [Paenibacillus tengchongensis]
MTITEPQHLFQLTEATIDQIQAAMQAGALTSVELTVMYLNRIYHYDRNGIRLNSIPVMNPDVLEEAAAMDRLRAEGVILGPLHGIPFTVKDSYMVKGLTVAAGSPAFANLTAGVDCFMVQKLREAGGVLIGKTNMPPMAAGGMQRGLYGRAESPYNKDYLPAAWFSGSSNGSGVSTAANLAVFGMAEETVSSGRSPASNNGLVAYTPSRGVLSIRGNWPLFPVRDVVVPHTRSVDDLLHVLDVIAVEDPVTAGDFWRAQTAVGLPGVSGIRPETYLSLKDKEALRGKRLGVPKLYIGKDTETPIHIRPSILKLWESAVKALEQLGAEVVEVDLPLLKQYDQDPILLKPMEERGMLPPGWMIREWDYLNPYAAEMFLQSVGDPHYPSWSEVDPATVFPNPRDSVDERRGRNNARYAENIEMIRRGIQPLDALPGFAEALRGLEAIRKADFEEWMTRQGLDLMVFPANCNIGRADADKDETAYDEAWENGNFFSNTNHLMRHLGIPSMSVCMGIMEDSGMPVNLTMMGAAYSDNELIRCAYAYEQATRNRRAPLRTPALQGEVVYYSQGRGFPIINRVFGVKEGTNMTTRIQGNTLKVEGELPEPGSHAEIKLYVNGVKAVVEKRGNLWEASVPIAPFLMDCNQVTRTLNLLLLCAHADGQSYVQSKTLPLPFLNLS